MGENTDGVLLAQALPNSNTDKARALQHAYGVAPRTSDGRGTKSSIPSLNGPSTNRVGSVNKQQNSREIELAMLIQLLMRSMAVNLIEKGTMLIIRHLQAVHLIIVVLILT